MEYSSSCDGLAENIQQCMPSRAMPIEARLKYNPKSMLKTVRGDSEGHGRYDIIDAESLMPASVRFVYYVINILSDDGTLDT